jgi:hypothetical protein
MFAAALGSASRALRRDECGDPRINGKRGHIYVVPGGLPALLRVREPEGVDLRQAHPFLRESDAGRRRGGVLIMDCLPTAEEAEAIRSYLRINKEREYDERHWPPSRKGTAVGRRTAK